MEPRREDGEKRRGSEREGTRDRNTCAACKSQGKIAGLTCGACAGSGDQGTYREVTAYRLGFAAGTQSMRDAIPDVKYVASFAYVRGLLDRIESEAAWERTTTLDRALGIPTAPA